MVDIQEGNETRNVCLRQVGVKNLVVPVKLSLEKEYRNSIGTIQMGVSLAADKHAIHMSRLVEIVNEWDGEITYESVVDLLQHVKERLNGAMAHIEIGFTYFKRKIAPVSKKASIMNYDCGIKANLSEDDAVEFDVTVKVPVASVCPCSKSISEYGAHNQRGIVTVTFQTDYIDDLKDVVEKVELSASAQLYSILKRVDEKHVTEYAYENSKFVEDIARDVILKMANDERYSSFQVEVENFESIHNHNAYAVAFSEDLKGVNENGAN